MNNRDEISNPGHDSAMVAYAVALLEQHEKIHRLSLALTLLAAIVFVVAVKGDFLSFGWAIALIAIFIMGGLELFYAIRVGFDLGILRRLEQCKDEMPTALSLLDKALVRLNLINVEKSGRKLDQRLGACIRLFKIQLGLGIGQMAAWVVVLAFNL